MLERKDLAGISITRQLFVGTKFRLINDDFNDFCCVRDHQNCSTLKFICINGFKVRFNPFGVSLSGNHWISDSRRNFLLFFFKVNKLLIKTSSGTAEIKPRGRWPTIAPVTSLPHQVTPTYSNLPLHINIAINSNVSSPQRIVWLVVAQVCGFHRPPTRALCKLLISSLRNANSIKENWRNCYSPSTDDTVAS